jgi:hypothetical protein
MAFNPNRAGTGRENPFAAMPDVTFAVPDPISRRPNVTGTRWGRAGFDPRRWWFLQPHYGCGLPDHDDAVMCATHQQGGA